MIEFGPAAFLAAFAAGVISFVSPCVLPLVPGYLSFISGVGVMLATGHLVRFISRLARFTHLQI